ncbi:disease resistance RPP13-like protein 4-like protein [Corchorus olitorius]|nr:disease resistance RPP13-like protein 4-like protein [Corchorus olitorius]
MTPIVRSCLIKFAKDASFFDYDEDGKPTMDFTSCKKACMVKPEGALAQWFSDYLDG